MAEHDEREDQASLRHATRIAHEETRSQRARNAFQRVAQWTSQAAGTPWIFLGAIAVVIGWALVGPIFHFSNAWQLVINTGTTIVTFLMVFLIQNTQNRDAKAIHLKLDELIRSKRGARNSLVDLENVTDAELDRIEAQFKRLREKADREPRKMQKRVEPAEP